LEENGWHLGNDQIKNIGSFIQLKYLKINCSGVTMLPDDIGNLYNLQTVNTCGCRIQMLPPSIGRLQNLVRLLVDFLWEVTLPDEVGDLQSLEVLMRLDCWRFAELRGAVISCLKGICPHTAHQKSLLEANNFFA
jgi:hypothetical protein